MVYAQRLLVLERTDKLAQLYAVELGKATNILGSVWNDCATSPNQEAAGDPAAAGITPLAKCLGIFQSLQS